MDIDVMVTHPRHTLAMRRTQAAKQDGTAARNAEQFKLNKYKHTTITPLVTETHGPVPYTHLTLPTIFRV